MGYVLKNNKWTLKLSKKMDKKSISKEKAPFGSWSAKKSLIHEFEGSKAE